MKEQAICELIEMTQAIPPQLGSNIKTVDEAKKIIGMLKEKGFIIFELREVGYKGNIFKTTFILQYNDDKIAQRDVHLDLKKEKMKEPDSYYSLYGAEPGEDI